MLFSAGWSGAGIILLLLPAFTAAGKTNAIPASGQLKVQWRHPAGFVTDETIAEIKTKLATQDWARRLYAERKEQLKPWLAISLPSLKQVFPKERGNVYHNFSCPEDRCRLDFSPLRADKFKCPVCNTVFRPDADAGIYPKSDRYHGTMYDGWICLFHFAASDAATDLGILGRTEAGGGKYAVRSIELLMLYADVIEKLRTKFDPVPSLSVLLTYHREGDNKILEALATAYELVREKMSPEQRARFERVVLQRMLDDLMLERIYTYDHNNVYQWHRTIVQTALALKREDLIDWSFGFGKWDAAHEPEHRSVQQILATHFKPDGAFWEMCSGYHLYPLQALCELAVLSRNLARMDTNRFPASRYDLTEETNPAHQVIENSLHWFMSLAPPDRVMPTLGDSMSPRGGMADYYATAEAGYRFYGLKAVGDYVPLREGKRTWAALLYGAPQILASQQAFTSSHLSSGWISLRNEWQGNRAWLGLNGLIPGGGHQHADRLTLLSYSHGQLLALEKATPYNESVTRELGTLSPSHNTITVDMQSQKQGETLKGNEIPKVAYFLTSPIAQFAELHADHLYPQTGRYRRSVALIEDFYVDFFRVDGGTNYDWMFHHAGNAPKFSIPMSVGEFAPADWLANGGKRVRHAAIGRTWEAKWSVEGVMSRLTMLGADGTHVYSMETYPVDNAVITPRNPPCQTLCVRRQGKHAAFLAVGDAWRNKPNVRSIAPAQGAHGLFIKTKSHTYHVLFAPGRASFSDGVSVTSDAAFTALRDHDALMLVHGTNMNVESSEGNLNIQLDKCASVSAELVNGSVKKELCGDIQYDTYAGIDHMRPVPEVKVTVAGSLWRERKDLREKAEVR